MNEKQKAGFAQWYKIHSIESNYRLVHQEMDRAYSKIEGVLSSSGLNLSPRVLMMSRTAPDRIDARNELVERYNQNRSDREQLPDAEKTANTVYQNLLGDVLEKYDFNSGNIVSRWTKSLAAGLTADVVEHPFLTLAGIAAGTVVGPVAGVLEGTVPTLVSRLVKSGIVAGTAMVPLRVAENKTKEELLKETEAYLSTWMTDAAAGAVLGEIFSVVNKGVSRALDYRATQTALRTALADAPAEVRADFVSFLQRELPQGTATYKSFIRDRENLKLLGQAFLDQDTETMAKILQEPTEIYQPKAPVDLAEPLQNATPLDQTFSDYINALKGLELMPEGALTEEAFSLYLNKIGKNNVQESIRRIPQSRRSSPTKLFASVLEEARRADTADRGAARAAITELSLERYPTIRSNRQYLEQDLDKLSSTLDSLFLENEPIKELSEALTEGFSRKEINSLRKDLVQPALDLNYLNTKLSTIEKILRVASNSESVNGKYLSGFTLMNNVRNALNVQIEEVRHISKRESISLNKDILDIVRNALKSDVADTSSVDITKLADAMITGKRGVGNKEYAIASRLKQYLAGANDRLVRYGAPAIENINDYWPNLWDPAKVGATTELQFVSTMGRLIDEEATRALATSRGRPIGAMNNFLRDMYQRIRADQPPRKTRNRATGDIVFSGDRIIVMKDGAAWVEAHELFGRTTDAAEVIGKITSSVRKKEHSASIGIYSDLDAEQMTAEIFRYLRDISSDKSDKIGMNLNDRKKMQKDLRLGEAQFQDVFKRSVSSTIEQEPIGGFVGGLLKLSKNSMLSTAFLTTLFTDTFGSMSILKGAIGMRNTVFREVLTLVSRADRRELTKIAAVGDLLNESLANKLDHSLWAKVKLSGEVVVSAPSALNSAISEFGEQRARVVYTSFLGQNKGKSLKNLPKDLRRFLERNGITEAEWEIYRKLKTLNLGNGVELLAANTALGGNTGNSKVIRKFALAERAAVNIGATASTALGETARIKPGLFPGSKAVAYFVDPFANITYSLFISQMSVFVDALANNRPAFAKMVIAMMMGGVITTAAKQALQGRNVAKIADDQEELSRFLLRSFMYASIFGKPAEMFVEAMEGTNQASALGMAAYQTAKALATLSPEGTFGAYQNLALSLNPYRNIGLIGQVAQKHTIDQLFMLLDPEGAIKKDQKLAEKLNNGQIFELRYKWLRNNPKPRRFR